MEKPTIEVTERNGIHYSSVDDLMDEINELHFDTGESPEALLKVYKWIWGQEDVNYPTGKGRNMSWEPLAELRNTL